MEALAQTDCAFVIDDFFEKSFGFNSGNNFHDAPFVVFFHYPPDVDLPDLGPVHLRPKYEEMFATKAWKLSENNLKAAFCFTDHLAEYLKTFVKAPILAVKHPTETRVPIWSFDAFCKSPKIVQAGEFSTGTRRPFFVSICRVQKWRLA